MLEFLSVFDWITPLVGFAQDIKNDPTLMQTNSWTFFIPYKQALNRGWNPNRIECLLNKKGIKTWGGQITSGEFFFSVELENAPVSEVLLLANNIPLNSADVSTK